VFLDFLAGIAGHTSSLSGVPLREDPVVAGWQLAEAPAHPGHPGSEALMVRGKQLQGGPCHAALPVAAALQPAFGHHCCITKVAVPGLFLNLAHPANHSNVKYTTLV
jgi:hypothetical protein